ncbi:hypothetical protein, partial [Parasutterella excrementihominis]|uniref:hypothetical protein n=1 Tax=Parasutterella excrementihominis TaxID=487175 RepID=UPI002670EE4F
DFSQNEKIPELCSGSSGWQVPIQHRHAPHVTPHAVYDADLFTLLNKSGGLLLCKNLKSQLLHY